MHHGSDAGVIQVLGSYFVQYFSPSGLNPLPKSVVFVIDVSGSMSGTKIVQTRQAMHAILGQLRPGDLFNIILFDHAVSQWKTDAVQVTNGNIQDAKAFVDDRVRAGGSTNINDALLTVLKLLKNTADAIAGKVPMVLFLTDGQPTAGETSPSLIRTNILRANVIEASIFSLGFGFNLDFDFLRALSAENGGTARRIYPGKDASGQLEGFFDEISTPLLLEIKFEYPKEVVDAAYTTASSFGRYYEGSELVVSGKLKEVASSRLMEVNVRGDLGSSLVTYSLSRTLLNLTVPADEVIIEDFTERLWAYMKIKQLLIQLLVSKNPGEQAQLKGEALRMSLKYNFVTPFTSLVVVQSDSYLEEEGGLDVRVFKRGSGESHASSMYSLSSAGLPVPLMLFFFVQLCVF